MIPKTALEIRNYINDLKLKTGCTVCGYRRNTAVLHFDHIDPSTKYRDKNGRLIGLAQMITGSGKDSKVKSRYSFKTIQAEIDKCRIVCSNCHGEHTWPQYQQVDPAQL